MCWAKAQHEHHAAILRKIGADAVVHPEWEMGSRVAKNLVSADFADWITLSADYSMVEVEVPRKWVVRYSSGRARSIMGRNFTSPLLCSLRS